MLIFERLNDSNSFLGNSVIVIDTHKHDTHSIYQSEFIEGFCLLFRIIHLYKAFQALDNGGSGFCGPLKCRKCDEH